MGTYRPTFGPGFVRVLLAAGALWTAALLAVEARNPGLRWWWVAYLIAGFAWNTYIWGLRIATGFRLGEHDLMWTTALRSGSVPVEAVASVRSLPLLTGIVVVRGAGMPWLLVVPQKGFAPFTRFLAFEAQPVDVRLGPWALLPERLPGKSAWRPDPDRMPDRGRHMIGGAARVDRAVAAGSPDDEAHRPRHLRPASTGQRPPAA